MERDEQTNRLHRKLRAFRADQSGQDLIEYALLVALVALGAVISLKTLATSIGNFWNQFVIKVASIWPT